MSAKQTPLQGRKWGNPVSIAIRELPLESTLDLRVEPGSAAQAAIIDVLGTALPDKPGRSEILPYAAGNAWSLRLSPDWWLLIGWEQAFQQLFDLKKENGYHFSIVDVSAQRTMIELEGPHARNVLAHLWEQDLREKSFPVGSVSQGLMAKAPVIVWHIAPDSYRVLVRSSFALHLWATLVDAATEYA